MGTIPLPKLCDRARKWLVKYADYPFNLSGSPTGSAAERLVSTRPGGSYSKTAGGKVSQTISSSPGSYTSHHSFFPFTNKNGVSSYQWYEYNPSLHKEEKKDGFRYKLILFEGKNLCFPNFNRNKDVLVKSCCLEYMRCAKNLL